MKLKIVDGKVALGSMFPVLWTGYVIGLGCFFLPILVIMVLIALVAVVSGSGELAWNMLPMAMMPVILAIQGAIFSGIVLLGLLVFRAFGKLEAEIVTTMHNAANVADT